MALDKGAQAVIFDISDDASAAAEVSMQPQLKLCQSIRWFDALTKHVSLFTAAGNRLISRSSRAGGCQRCRGADGFGQQERGGQCSD